MTAVPVKIRKAVYRRLREEIEAGREPDNICDVVSKAVTFYLDSKKVLEALNPPEVSLEELHSKENTAKNRPRKRGLPPGVCASPRKSLSAKSWLSPPRVFRVPSIFLCSRRLIPAFGRFKSEDRLHFEDCSFEELEESAKRIVVKHPALFGNFQLSDTGIRVVKHPDGSLEVISQQQ
ncbi:MAG: hypothetical protein DRO98_06300 [Archaeoglobales archaeon]|nr:MAG: hypothetical protein DRO98_06300 [Archaeoglobales archaeon]